MMMKWEEKERESRINSLAEAEVKMRRWLMEEVRTMAAWLRGVRKPPGLR
jgi:hypothetical protein